MGDLPPLCVCVFFHQARQRRQAIADPDAPVAAFEPEASWYEQDSLGEALGRRGFGTERMDQDLLVQFLAGYRTAYVRGKPPQALRQIGAAGGRGRCDTAADR